MFNKIIRAIQKGVQKLMGLNIDTLKEYTELSKAYINEKVEEGKITKTSELKNDSGFVTEADVNQKYVTKEEAAKLATAFMVVDKLPTEDIPPNVIFLVKADGEVDTDMYKEFVRINNSWEELGHRSVLITTPDITSEQIQELWKDEIENVDDKEF